jgi:hypothetical protein
MSPLKARMVATCHLDRRQTEAPGLSLSLAHPFVCCYFKAGSIRGRGRGAAGNRTPGPRGSYLGGYSAGRGIYSRYHEGKGKQQEKGYELVPNLEISPVNPVAIKPGTGQYKPEQTHHLVLNPTHLFQVSPSLHGSWILCGFICTCVKKNPHPHHGLISLEFRGTV